jgi:hypothetical protein
MNNLITILCCAGLVAYPLILGIWLAYQVLYLGAAIDAELSMIVYSKI